MEEKSQVESVYFESAGRRLFGCVHLPVPANANGLGFVVCHPFAHERLRVHRVFFNFAEALCRGGCAVLRFDYAGCGDSEGRWEDATVASMRQDVGGAVSYLRSSGRVTELGLIGLRWGATLACLAAEELPCISRLALIAPTLRPREYVFERLRGYLSTEAVAFGKIQSNRNQLIAGLRKGSPVNLDGFTVGSELYLGMEEIDLLASPKAFAGDVLGMDLRAGPTGDPGEPAGSLLTAYGGARSKRHELVDTPPFWDLMRTYCPEIPAPSAAIMSWVAAGHAAEGEADSSPLIQASSVGRSSAWNK